MANTVATCAILLMSLLAGCLGDSPPASPSGAAEGGTATSPPSQGSSSPTAGPGSRNATPPPPVPHVYHATSASLATASGVATDRELDIPVTAQTVRIEAVLTYSSEDHAQDLDVVLAEPGTDGLCMLVVPCVGSLPTLTWTDPPAGWHENMNGTVGSPDSPSTLALEPSGLGAFCDCTWKAMAYSRAPLTAAVKFTLEVTVWEQPQATSLPPEAY